MPFLRPSPPQPSLGRFRYQTAVKLSHFLDASRQYPSPAARRLLRLAAVGPSQPANPDATSGTALSSFQPAENGPSNNGTPAASPSGAYSTNSSASGTASSDTAGASGSGIVTVSKRASIRSILKTSYLGELLFVTLGGLLCVAVTHWTVGTSLRRFNPYTFHVILPEAPGVDRGTPVRMKGVPIGSVLTATPQLQRVSVEVEVNEAKTIIPRNARFELTQSGLIPAANLDISPPEGVSADTLAAAAASATRRGGSRAAAGAAAAATSASEASSSTSGATGESGGVAAAHHSTRSRRQHRMVRLASPKDVAACRLQGVLVCQGDQLDGSQGGSMDELTARMLKSLRQGEEDEAARPGAKIVPGRGPVQG